MILTSVTSGPPQMGSSLESQLPGSYFNCPPADPVRSQTSELQPANHGAPPDFSGHHGQQTAPVLSAPWLVATVGPGSSPWSPSVFPSRDFALLGPVLDDVLGSRLHLNGEVSQDSWSRVSRVATVDAPAMTMEA